MQDASERIDLSPAAAGTAGKPGAPRSRLAAFLDSDMLHSFLRSRLVVVAAVLSVAIVTAAFLAPVIAPHDPYDLKSLSLLDANTPPAWEQGGERQFPLGTDDQGRDILSTILYGTRSSLPTTQYLKRLQRPLASSFNI